MRVYLQDRTKPLQLFDDFSVLESLPEVGETLHLRCSRQEYFVFQLLLVSEADSQTLCVACDDGEAEKRVTCFNTEGNDKWGKAFRKDLTVSKREIQPLYFGVNPEGLAQDTFRCSIRVLGENTREIQLTLELTDEAVENHGYNELWRLSRLNWLNSNAFRDEKAVPPYTPVQAEGFNVSFLARHLVLGQNGLPEQMESYLDEALLLQDEPQAKLFASPMRFILEGETITYAQPQWTTCGDNALLQLQGEGDAVDVEVRAKVHYEGFLDYRIHVKAKRDCTLPQISLQTALTSQASVYNNGFSKYGGKFGDIHYRWNAEHQDSVFIGGVNCGMRVKLKAEQYQRPLVNIYYKSMPRLVPEETWDNHGAGTVDIARQQDGCALLCACTGVYAMQAGEERVFSFELHLTPFHPIDYKKHYAVRYRHNGEMKSWEKELALAKKNGLTHITIHHANDLNPFINYPFIEVEEMKAFTKACHAQHIAAKFYYTSREHSNHMEEIFAYKALGDEIVLRKSGLGQTWAVGKSEWLPTYFGENYTPAWRVEFERGKYKGEVDEAFIVHPDSRLDNYYIEGLDWLVKEIGIDGIYIDDTALDRTTLERARKVLDQNGGLIDMHMWNHEEDRAGNISCMNLYTEIFPFLDSIWIGEGYPYNTLSEDYMMTEVSGIPYGLLGEMLEDGGNPWYGMLYAMNNRYGWHNDRHSIDIYGLWDSFGIQDAQMRGYWHSKTPVKADHPQILVTSYMKDKSVLVAVYNTSQEMLHTTLQLEAEHLGFAVNEAFTPHIKGLQREKKVSLQQPLQIAGKQGVLLILKG